MFDVDGGKVRQTLTGQALTVNGIKFTPDSQLSGHLHRQLAAAELPGELRVWEVASGRELARLDGHPTEIKRSRHDGRWQAAGLGRAPTGR